MDAASLGNDQRASPKACELADNLLNRSTLSEIFVNFNSIGALNALDWSTASIEGTRLKTRMCPFGRKFKQGRRFSGLLILQGDFIKRFWLEVDQNVKSRPEALILGFY